MAEAVVQEYQIEAFAARDREGHVLAFGQNVRWA